MKYALVGGLCISFANRVRSRLEQRVDIRDSRISRFGPQKLTRRHDRTKSERLRLRPHPEKSPAPSPISPNSTPHPPTRQRSQPMPNSRTCVGEWLTSVVRPVTPWSRS